jgi:phage baseplate assembly protein W
MHIDYPFHVGSGGRTAGTDDDDYVRDLVEQVLFTAPGERVNRPTFGSGILRLVFEPGGAEVATATQFLVQAALQQWLADLVEVQAVQVDSEDSTLRVSVRYRPLTAAEPRTAVFVRPV